LKFDKVEARVVGGSKTQTTGLNFLTDTEYLGATIPAPAYKDVNPDVS
jgi:hypothetical protein